MQVETPNLQPGHTVGEASDFFDRQNQSMVLGQALFVRAEGACLWDDAGRRFLDFNNNATVPLGHDISAIEHACASGMPLNVGLYGNRDRMRLIGLLEEIFPLYGGFQFYCSGTAANEAMLRYAVQRTGRSVFGGFQGTYYGRTVATSSLSAMESYNCERIDGYAMLPFPRLDPVNDCFVEEDADANLAAIADALDEIGSERVAAVVIEPILSKRLIAPPPGWLQCLKNRLLAPRGILLIADEYLLSARAGAWCVTADYGVLPDVFCFGKCYTPGVPFAGIAALKEHVPYLDDIWSGDTYGGQPLVSRAVVRTIEQICDEGLIEREHCFETAFLARFESDAGKYGIRRVCAFGGMLGLEMSSAEEARAVGRACFAQGLLVAVVKNIVRLTPALTITDELLFEGMDILRSVLHGTSANGTRGVPAIIGATSHNGAPIPPRRADVVPRHVIEIVERAFPDGATMEVLEMPPGRMNRIFQARHTRTNRSFAIRLRKETGDHPELAGRVADPTVRELLDSRIVIPELLLHGRTSDGTEFHVHTWIDGSRFDHVRLDAPLARECGRMLASIHATTGTVFVDDVWNGFVSPAHATWYEMYRRTLASETEHLGRLFPSIARMIEGSIDALSDALPVDSRAVLTHNDYHARNIIRGESGLIVIDWDRAGFRDRLVDLIKPLRYNIDPAGQRESFVAGYNDVSDHPLAIDHIDLTPFFVLWHAKMLRFEYCYPVTDRYFQNYVEHGRCLIDLCSRFSRI